MILYPPPLSRAPSSWSRPCHGEEYPSVSIPGALNYLAAVHDVFYAVDPVSAAFLEFARQRLVALESPHG